MTEQPYRILVTGPRDWMDRQVVWGALAAQVQLVPPERETILVEGGASGVDHIARDWGRSYGLTIETHYADWDKHSRMAGPIRNLHMVSLGADVCLAFLAPCTRPDCRIPRPHDTHGTAGCVVLAEAAGIPTLRMGRRP